MTKNETGIEVAPIEIEAQHIINSLAPPREVKESRDSIRARAVESAARIFKAAGVAFARGHVLLIASELKAVVAFDIPEMKSEAEKYTNNKGFDLFHIRSTVISNAGLFHNIVRRIAEGRGREIFDVTEAQKTRKTADVKTTSEIVAKTGGKISSRKYPARF